MRALPIQSWGWLISISERFACEDGEDRGFNFGPLETVVVIMAGTAEGGEGENGAERRERIGAVRDVFDGPPWAFAHLFTTFGVRALSPFVEMVLV